MKNYIITFFLITIISSGCDKSRTSKIEEKNTSKYVKIWFDTIRTYPYIAELKIKKNNTFEFFSGACTYRSISKGTWIIKNDTIILNSSQPKDCFYMCEYGTICKTIEEINKRRDRKKSIKDCNADIEFEYELFSNEKFYLKNDTLVHVKQNKQCAGLEFAYTSKQKKD